MLYKLVDDDELVVVSNEMYKRFIGSTHEKGHFAAKKAKEFICREFSLSHNPCILTNRKRGKQEGLPHPLQKEDVPLFTYHIDSLGPHESTHKDYKHILAIIDSFIYNIISGKCRAFILAHLRRRIDLTPRIKGFEGVLFT